MVFFSVVSKNDVCTKQPKTQKIFKINQLQPIKRNFKYTISGPQPPISTNKKKTTIFFQSSRPLRLNKKLHISEVPGFHQLPKRLCAFARVAVRCAVALGKPVRGRLGPASLGRAGALAGRGKRLDLKGKLKGKVTEKGWKISQLVVFFLFLLLHHASWVFSSCTKNKLVNLVINLQESALVSGIVINSFIHSFTHSFTHSFSHSVIHSFTHSFTDSLTQSFSHSFTHSFIHSLSHSFIHSVIHSLIHQGPVKSIHSVHHEGKFFPHFHQSHSTQMVCRFPSCNCFGTNFQNKKPRRLLHIHSTVRITHSRA